MKKIIAIIMLCLMVVCVASGCADTPIIEVTDGEITDMVFFNKITNQVNYNYLSYTFIEPDLSEQYKKVVLPENAEDVKNQIIENKIITEKCKSSGILFTMDEAKETVQSEYEQVKQEPSQSEYYSILLSVLIENDITEAEYLLLMESEAYYKCNKIGLKNHFSAKLYDSSKSETLDEQFNAYISKLVDEYSR